MSRCQATSIAVLAAIFLAATAVRADAPKPVPVLQGVGIDQKLRAQLPLDAPFRDEAGRTVRLGDCFDGRRPVILNLVYFGCPMLCTLTLNDTLYAVRSIPKLAINQDFQIVTVSFNPRETPDLAAAKKRNYLDQYRRSGAEEGWHFLTGDQASIDRLTDAAGFRYHWDAAHNQYAHASAIMVITPQGKISRYLFGLGYDAADLRLSLVEASAGKIGSVTDQVLLYCFHWDPTAGKYTLAVINALRAGAVLIIVVLGGGIFLMLRRDRKRAAADGGAGVPGTRASSPASQGHAGEDARAPKTPAPQGAVPPNGQASAKEGTEHTR